MPNRLQGHVPHTKGNAVSNISTPNFGPLQVRRAMVVRTAARDAGAEALLDFMQKATGIQVNAPASGMTSFAFGSPDFPEGLSIAWPVRDSEMHWLWLGHAETSAALPAGVGAQFDQVLAQAADQSLLHAVELTDAHCAFELCGFQAPAVLQRLMDSLSIPTNDNGFSRLRLVDIAVNLIRLNEGHYLIVADVHHADYIREWVTHSLAGMG